ncbi:MAG: hypothetical protein SFU98_14115 [Leptospiraceae bacterium]|nr:hypothetical protein [Leptospiraceae bacterium]
MYKTLTLLILILFLECKPKSEYKPKPRKIVLDVLLALDLTQDLPSKKDVLEILGSAQKTIQERFGSDLTLEFNIKKITSLEFFFDSLNYKFEFDYQTFTEFYKFDYSKGYTKDYSPKFFNVSIAYTGENNTGFISKFEQADYFEEYANHLKFWKVEALNNLFPNEKFLDHKDAAKKIFAVYLEKISNLKKLKSITGKNFISIPPKKWQSFFEWTFALRHQQEYDIIITNTIIVEDNLKFPSPHIVSKLGKIGGFVSENIYREDLFGHAYYSIPDVYDHELDCIMNSSDETKSYSAQLEMMEKNIRVCKLCKSYINHRNKIMEAEDLFIEKKFNEAGETYLESIQLMPDSITDKNWNLEYTYNKALQAFQKAGNAKQVERVIELKKELGFD